MQILRLVVGIILLTCSITANAKDKVVVIPLGDADFKPQGQTCPQGQLLVGFDSEGELVCRTLSQISPLRILGLSTNSFSGEISFGGETGSAGARAACQTSFAAEPEARLCTEHDISRVLQLDNTTSAVRNSINNVATWTTFNGTGGGTSDTSTTLNNCFGLSDDSGTIARGTRLFVTFDSASAAGNVIADRAIYLLGLPCSSVFPVLCCSGL